MDLILFCKSTLFKLGIMELLKNIESINSIEEVPNLSEIQKKTKENLTLLMVFDDYQKETLEELHYLTKNSNINILVIDLDGSKKTIEHILSLNINGYLNSSSNNNDIIFALEKIKNNEKYFHSSVTELFMKKQKGLNELNSLSRRENEILIEIAAGNSNSEISFNLQISENTVKKHICNIFKKINCKDRVQATIYAYKLGVL